MAEFACYNCWYRKKLPDGTIQCDHPDTDLAEQANTHLNMLLPGESMFCSIFTPRNSEENHRDHLRKE